MSVRLFYFDDGVWFVRVNIVVQEGELGDHIGRVLILNIFQRLVFIRFNQPSPAPKGRYVLQILNTVFPAKLACLLIFVRQAVLDDLLHFISWKLFVCPQVEFF